ncbi:excinuclease ABC subunit UvrA [Actinomadura sp. ATCC 31491]|uniref:UvrABC system protein A n=1 Tax=Actinomadura luzonensis TaxID=2805427 RepID=A0ABT0G9M4_9ACTN|nr:excinuclease ABC subunit UvrA [Actinomadura luzonensis]MCK2221103.1 excinuclease ABC subunit UvrA [Actinomadura luzonensis]
MTDSTGGAVEVTGARTHNLRGIDVRLPHGRIVAFTGVSGSGKTSLAIDTVHAEAQLRYLEGLSPFVRQFITPKDRPKVDRITGLGVTLAVDQRNANRSHMSTVASLTGLDDYLRLLFARLPGLATGAGAATRALTTAHFDRFSPEGRCPACLGLGGTSSPDPHRLIERPGLPLLAGATTWFDRPGADAEAMAALARLDGVDLALPWRDLPARFRERVLHGTGEEGVRYTSVIRHKRTGNEVTIEHGEPLPGLLAEVDRLYRASGTDSARARYEAYMSTATCPRCGGSGFGESARSVALAGHTYPELVEGTVDDLAAWAALLPTGLNHGQREVADTVLADLGTRLSLLSRLGIGHLQVNRTAPSLSGGELQRTRTAAQLSTALTGVIFVLDEPSAGLHPADKEPLEHIVRELRDAGNTVLLVEHDPDLVAAADWVVDIGPGAGRHGGRLVAAGTPEHVAAVPESVTGRYLASDAPRIRRRRRPPTGRHLVLREVDVHNVHLAEVALPLGVLTCVTGVSGSGKSSLLHDALGRSLAAALNGGDDPGTVGRLDGADRLTWVRTVDQQPIGRTPRSNPATYTKAFDHIRKLFAATPQARARGLTASSFSFNSPGGRCEDCTGYGRRLIDLSFLPGMWVTCETCDGRRFTPPVLEVAYQGLAIDQVLELTVEEAARVFAGTPAVARVMDALTRVGLGYLALGQSAMELSGGEAQRIKLAAALLQGAQERGNGLVIIDEPLAGLHPADVQRIFDGLDALLDQGTTVVIAEHDLHAAAVSDWLIDMGPGAGPAGGRVLAAGTPEEVAAADTLTARYLRDLKS